MLELYGLPADSPLSVLCVEILPTITNIYEYINEMDNASTKTNLKTNVGAFHPNFESDLNMASEKFSNINFEFMAYLQQSKPLSDQLGEYRILRTSPLTEVPFVCCTNC